jgi:NDP-sugar pyrophosphorylase family protein
MKALILLGGLGTRLKPLTSFSPKPLLPILNRPFIGYQLDLLKKYGVREVVLALGHQAAHFRRALGDGRRWGVRLTYSLEKEPLGTGGAIRLALPHLSGPAYILNGDVLSDFDLGQLAAVHRHRKADATVVLVEVDDPSHFGLVETDREGTVRRFLEKPSGGKSLVRTVNAGCYLFSPKVVERIPSGRAVSIEREIFPALLSEKFRVGSFLHRGYWSDIGTLSRYWRTHRDLHERGEWPKGLTLRKGLRLEKGVVVGKSPKVLGTAVIGEGAWVGDHVEFEGHVTLGARTRIESSVRLSDCVILEGVRIGSHTRVEKSIIGPQSVVGSHCFVGPDQVLGSGARLPSHSQVFPGLMST